MLLKASIGACLLLLTLGVVVAFKIMHVEATEPKKQKVSNQTGRHIREGTRKDIYMAQNVHYQVEAPYSLLEIRRGSSGSKIIEVLDNFVCTITKDQNKQRIVGRKGICDYREKLLLSDEARLSSESYGDAPLFFEANGLAKNFSMKFEGKTPYFTASNFIAKFSTLEEE